MKTIAISEETHRRLIEMKMQEKVKTADELLGRLLIESRKQKLNGLSDLFRRRLAEKGMTLADLLKKSRKIREEIADEWYPD